MIAAGGSSWGGRTFEAEAARPYGVWIDILRAIAAKQSRETLPPDLSLLLPEPSTGAALPVGRSRLFDAVLDLLRQFAAERPTVLTFDDIQWIDDTSASLLHYVARHVDASSGLLIARRRIRGQRGCA
jgi:predicted ATPase